MKNSGTAIHQREGKGQALFPFQHLYHSTWGDKAPQLLTAERINGFKETFFIDLDFICR